MYSYSRIVLKKSFSNVLLIKRDLRGRAMVAIKREEIIPNQPVSLPNLKIEEPIENISTLNTNIKKKKKPYFVKNKVKIQDGITLENQFEKLNQTVTPLWKISYEQQLNIKYKFCVQVLKSLANNLKELKLDLPRDQLGLPCTVELTRPSPLTERYRNKDEFSMRYGVDGSTRTVGFFVGNFTDGQVYCVEPDNLLNVKKEHLIVAKTFQNFIRESPYDICTSIQHGYWRRIIVRSNSQGEMMLTVIMHPQDLSESEIEIEKSKLIDFFINGPGMVCNVTSLYFQACRHSRCTHKQAPFQHLAGKKYLIETVDDLQLRISPETFSQVNTGGAQVLYDTIKAFADLRKDTTLLDICCGAGAISLSVAKSVCRTVGIELSTQAVEDAKFNAELNGIKNASFYQGRAERLVPQLMPELLCSDCVAVVNPGRAGLELAVINALRESKQVRRIIYVACKPEGNSKQNFIDLCKPARGYSRLGKPFLPIHAIPVDMFPLTYHCELVLVFERF